MAGLLLPSVDTWSDLTDDQHDEVLDILFQPCEQLRDLVKSSSINSRNFATYDALISEIGTELEHLILQPVNRLLLDAIIGSYPRIGTDNPERPQNQDKDDNAAVTEFRLLNDEYEKKFPGLRYVVSVKDRSKSAIINDIRRRIAVGDLDTETVSAIKVGQCQRNVNYIN